MTDRIIKTGKDIRSGVKALSKLCPKMRGIHKMVGDPPLRRRAAGFPGLARIVVGQQLSVASASAIWRRVEQTVDPLTADRLLALDDEALRGAGLSRPKIRTLRALSSAVANDGLNLARFGRATDHTIHERLTAIHGIGDWTADIFIMFCLGRADGWAPGDLALQYAVQSILELDERPKLVEMSEISERWRPWRGVGARLLWSYYGALREGRTSVPL